MAGWRGSSFRFASRLGLVLSRAVVRQPHLLFTEPARERLGGGVLLRLRRLQAELVARDRPDALGPREVGLLRLQDGDLLRDLAGFRLQVADLAFGLLRAKLGAVDADSEHGDN